MDGNTDIRPALRQIIANRHTPEARALGIKLMEYAHGRINRVVHQRYPDLISQDEAEELVHDVMLVLLPDGLAAFRGTSLRQLLAYVRSIADRTVWRTAGRRLRERRSLEGEGAQSVRDWSGRAPQPDELVQMVPDNPLSQKDSDFLQQLFRSGTKATLARDMAVSRAAVTQRLQRIIRRMQALPPAERARAEAWVRFVAVREQRRPRTALARAS